MFRKSTHTDRYLHWYSNHQPTQKREVMNNLIYRALRICEPHFLEDELDNSLHANGYSTLLLRLEELYERGHLAE